MQHLARNHYSRQHTLVILAVINHRRKHIGGRALLSCLSERYVDWGNVATAY